MRILIHDEYAAGREPADGSEVAQADLHRALVAALAVDVAKLAVHEVRLSLVYGDADIHQDLAWADAAFLLAAETSDRLTSLAELCEAANVRVLGPSARAIRLVSDRMGLTLALGEVSLPVPRTWRIGVERADLWERITSRLGFPVVVKPLVGAGGRGIRLVDDVSAMRKAVDAARSVDGDDEFVLQEYVPGLGAGVGLLRTGDDVLPLGLWGALVSEPPTMFVERCATPFEHDGVAEAVALAVAAAQAVPGIEGYVEIDLILAHPRPVIVEITPRPLLGTLALRRSRQFNLAALILDACVDGRLPDTRFWPPEMPSLVDLSNPAAALSSDIWSA